MGEKIKQLKEFLKSTAQEIREKKILIKKTQRMDIYAGLKQSKLVELKFVYRHHHIAYSELKGRRREEIESPRADHLPDNRIISELKRQYQDVEPQTLCSCS